MPAIAIIGAQWGDEGKGKVVDLLAGRAQMVARFSGGNNAGHTVINELGEFRLHLVPAGILHPHTTCIIGNGVVVDPRVLLSEMEELVSKGTTLSGRFFISDRANVIMPYHVLFDRLEEQARGHGAIGTTGRGIGPTFTDKVARSGIRMADILDPDYLSERLRPILERKNRIMTRVYDAEPLSFDDVYRQCLEYGERLRPHICDTSRLVGEALDRGETVLLEGAQGTLLDIDYGTYPYVTSSTTWVGGACAGLGLPPSRISGVIGVSKAYTTRVGAGPLPTEIGGELEEELRDIAGEYGATTGRPRRCGWFDAVVVGHSARLNGFTAIALTRLDVLSFMPSIQVCTAYELDGQVVSHFPPDLRTLARCRPVYETLPGWQTPIDHLGSFDELPQEAQDYVRRIEEIVGCPVGIVSIGPRREQSIVKTPLL